MSLCLCIICVNNYNFRYSKDLIENIKNDDKEEFERLLKEDKNLDSRPYFLGIDLINMPPLIYAIKFGKDEYVYKLVENGTDVNNTKHPYDKTPLMFSLEENDKNFEIARYLIDNGADIHIEVNGKTALNYVFTYKAKNDKVLAKEEFDFAMYLIDNGAVIETDRWHVIYDAARMNNTFMLEYLVYTRNVNININDNVYGNTPLLWAVQLGSYDAVNWLIENGADINIINKDGKNAHDIAKERNIEEIIMLIENKMKKGR